MGLPYVKEIPKSRSYIHEFRGYNHKNIISETEQYDCCNLTDDEYPVLASRKRRSIRSIDEGYEIIDALSAEEVFVLAKNNNKLYLRRGHGTFFEIGAYEPGARYQMVRMGANVIIFPLCYCYNTATEEGNRFFSRATLAGVGELVFANCIKNSDGTYKRITVHLSKDKAWTGTYYLNDLKTSLMFYNPEGEDYTVVPKIMVKGLNLRNGIFKFIETDVTEIYKYLGNLNEIVEIDGEEWCIFGATLRCNEMRLTHKTKKTYNGVGSLIAEESGVYNFVYETGITPMDYVIECQNRLWGCRADGKVNEIYCTALGSYSDWYSYGSSPGDAYAVSVGSVGDFTGAAVIGENPVFFKESVIHKVYVSSSGAHQLYTLDCRGVQKGSSRSIVKMNETVIYKSKYDVVLFDGTTVTPISEAFGNEHYTDAKAGSIGSKYVLWCKKENTPYLFIYDLKKGFWQRESAPEDVICFSADEENLYIFTPGEEISLSERAGDGFSIEGPVSYMLESGIQGITSPDGKYLVRLDYRVALDLGATFNVWIQYDSDGRWISVARLTGQNFTAKPQILPVLPRRCDYYKIRITGRGSFKLYSVAKVFEEGAGYGY